MKERLKNFFIVVLSMMLSLTSLFLPIQSTKVNAAAVEPSTGNIYYIKNKNSGLYLQVANNSSNSGSNVIQANGTGAEGQRWILEKNSSGTYRLHPATDMTGSVSLDVANASSSNGANIGIFKNNGCSAQNFKLVKADNNNGYYLMTETTNFNSCVEVNRASKNNGAKQEIRVTLEIQEIKVAQITKAALEIKVAQVIKLRLMEHFQIKN